MAIHTFFKHIAATSKADNWIFFFIVMTFLALPVGNAFPLIMITCAIAASLFSGRMFRSGCVFQKNWLLPAFLFIVLPWIGLCYSEDLGLGIDYALKTKYWVAAVVTAQLYLDENRLMTIVSCLWFGLFCGGILALVQFSAQRAGLQPPFFSEFFGFGLAYTVLSMYLIIGILMASRCFKNTHRKDVKGLMLILMSVFFFHLSVLSGRNGYFVMVLISPLIINNMMPGKQKMIQIGGMIVLACALVFSPVVKNRIAESVTFLKQTDTILEGKIDPKFPRPFMYHTAARLLIENPITGIGTGSLKSVTKKMGFIVNHPHNNILYMGVSFGILGIISILWLFGKMVMTAWKNRESQLGYFVFSIGIVIFLGGFFDTLIINSGTSLLLPMGYGLLNHLNGNN